MKTFFLIFEILFCLSVIGQTDVLIGDYSIKHEANNGLIEYSLTLKSDGTFTFRYYDKIDNRIQKERIQFAKGTWENKKNVVYFFSDESNINGKFNLNFNNSKARFITKSPSDKSDKIVKTSLLFHDSEIFWVKGMKLYKN